MGWAALAFLAASASLPAAPDLSGNWKLNGSKSDFGELLARAGLTQQITHAEPKVEGKMPGDMGDIEFTAKYTTDGNESTHHGFGGAEAKSLAKWEGETLLRETEGAFRDNAYTIVEPIRGRQGPDVPPHFSSGMGELDQKLVFG